MKAIKTLVLLLALGLSAYGQGVVVTANKLKGSDTAPSGTCGAQRIELTTAGVIWTCASGTWSSAGGGFGGTVTTGNIPYVSASNTFSNSPVARVDASNITIGSIKAGLGGGNVSQNTVFGEAAIAGSATGNYNTAIGYSALTALTSGQQNVAIGRLALYTVTIGNFNVAIGASAGQALNGSSNVAIGASAMSSATGSDSVAIGSSALAANTASFNVAIGTDSLKANTSGQRNMALGASTLFTNTTGSFNVAFGEIALYNANASNNTAIGRAAGYEVSSGANNTFLGYDAGRGITTGSNNTIIGANVTGLTSSLANNIVIADGSGNQRINVDSAGKVGLGIAAPAAHLDVRPGSSSTIGQIIQLASGQTARALNIRDSTATFLSGFDASGRLEYSSGITSTTATAGAQTLPANPAGFLVITIGGTQYKVPYYGN